MEFVVRVPRAVDATALSLLTCQQVAPPPLGFAYVAIDWICALTCAFDAAAAFCAGRKSIFSTLESRVNRHCSECWSGQPVFFQRCQAPARTPVSPVNASKSSCIVDAGIARLLYLKRKLFFTRPTNFTPNQNMDVIRDNMVKQTLIMRNDKHATLRIAKQVYPF